MRLTILFILLWVAVGQSYGQTSTPMTPRIAARLILVDSLSPSDDSMTFMVMDSIIAARKDIRDYYFPAFQKISEKADGALAEVIGSYVLLYVKQYPKEFSDRYSYCLKRNNCDNMTRLASFAGEETMMRDDNQKEYSDLVDQMTAKYKNWRQDKLLSKFIERVDKVRREWKD